jgi:protoporphyrinogen oxidase
MMWETCAEKVRRMGGKVLLGRRALGFLYHGDRRAWTVTAQTADGGTETYSAEHLISSMPMRELAGHISPPLPPDAIEAAGALKYRDFLTVGLIAKEQDRFSDNWIYIHDPGVKVGRIQNYKSWSPEMAPDPAYCCYGLEYFCFEGDGTWTMADEDLISLAKRELEQLGLGRSSDVLDGCVIRQSKAYPVYDGSYQANVAMVRAALERNYDRIHLVGRNGMHKYNNQDHAMMTAMLTARNIAADARMFDVWAVNQDAEYHESGAAGHQSVSGLRAVPERLAGDE